MTAEEKFNAAVNVIRSLPKDGPYQPSHDMMLKFYGLYKQATEGHCNDPKPAFYELVKLYKWRAWHNLGEMSQHDAMNTYVEELKKVLEAHWIDYNSKLYENNNKNRNNLIRLPYSHAPVQQDIVETMSYTENVASFIDALGPFYEYVDLPGLKKEDKHAMNNNSIIVRDEIIPNGHASLSKSSSNDISNGENHNADFSYTNCHKMNGTTSPFIEEGSTSGYQEDGSISEEQSVSETLEHYSATSVISDDLDSACEYITVDKVKEVHCNSFTTATATATSKSQVNGYNVRHRISLLSDSESDEEYSEPAEIINNLRDDVKPSDLNGKTVPMATHGGGDSATPGGLQMSLPSMQYRHSGTRSRRASSHTSHVSGGSPGHAGNGGQGGKGNGNGREPHRQSGDVNGQLVMVLQQIQSDMANILVRLNALETSHVSQCSHGCHYQNSPVHVPERSWWPFPELSPRSTFFLLAWPLILHGGVKLLILLRSRRRRQS